MKQRPYSFFLIAALAIVLLLAGCNRPDQQVALATPEPVNPQVQPTLPGAVQPTLPPAVTPSSAEPDMDATMKAAAGVTTAEPTPAGVGEATALPPVTEPLVATNTPGPQPTAAPQPTATKSPTGETIHTVQSGERLFSIARLYKVNPYAIAQLNGLAAPYLIYPGQKLKIPGSGPSATPVPNQTPVPGAKTYTVQPGDNLFRIALKFGKSMQAIAAANNISNYNFIFVGQVLKIP